MTSNPGVHLNFTQHVQQPQQHYVCPVVVSGSRPLAHAVIPQPPLHQTMVSPSATAAPTSMGSSVLPQSGSTDHSVQPLAMSQYRPLVGK